MSSKNLLPSPWGVRGVLSNFIPYTPGLSIAEIQKKYGLDTVIKLASNENPLGVSPRVQDALARHAAFSFRYPQSDNRALVATLAVHHNVAPERIVIGNGSDEILDLLIRVRGEPKEQNVVAFSPCFSIYKLQSLLCGVSFFQAPLNEDFSFNWAEMLRQITKQTTIVFLTTPDNPSGYCPPLADVAFFSRSLPDNCLLVLDEAYMDFTGDEASYSLLSRLDHFPNVAITRTFSKSFGLAGLRLGYGILPPQLAEVIRQVRLPFSVNILAEAAGLAALEDKEFYQQTLDLVLHEREHLMQELHMLGCTVYPSKANFIMFCLPTACSLTAQEFFQGLLEQGVIIRPLSSYNLPEHLRVSIGTAAENAIFIKKARALLGIS